MDRLIFDIETIPSIKPLTPVLNEAVEARVKRELEYTKETDVEEVRRRIMATSPFYGEICVICWQINDEDPITLYGDEKEILEAFWNAISGFSGIFVSYNGLRFDVPFIITRSMYHKIKPTNKNFLQKRRFSFFPHFDVHAALTDWGEQRGIGLKVGCDFFGIRSSKTGEVVASNVAEYVANGQIKKVAEYCAEDVRATNEVYSHVSKYVIV